VPKKFDEADLVRPDHFPGWTLLWIYCDLNMKDAGASSRTRACPWYSAQEERRLVECVNQVFMHDVPSLLQLMHSLVYADAHFLRQTCLCCSDLL